MYTLIEVFSQATQNKDNGILDSLDYQARIERAIKIVKDNETDIVNIFNTTLGGDYYKEINKDEYRIFTDNGWKYGIYVLSLSNYRRKLINIEERIKQEFNGRKNGKSIQLSKTRRLTILKNFSEVSNKLKQLQNGEIK
tara:strand:+ start:3477 stop:3893 length:417 start_codon:yes stop_codon:yes gene_type:complete